MAVPQVAFLAQGKEAKENVVVFEATSAPSEPTWTHSGCLKRSCSWKEVNLAKCLQW